MAGPLFTAPLSVLFSSFPEAATEAEAARLAAALAAAGLAGSCGRPAGAAAASAAEAGCWFWEVLDGGSWVEEEGVWEGGAVSEPAGCW